MRFSMSFDTTLLQGPLLVLWGTIVSFLPNVIGAVTVFVIGVGIAVVLRQVIVRMVALLRIDELVEKLEIKKQFERMGFRLHVGALLGWIVKWFFIIVSLIAATDILGWKEVTDYLTQVVLYVPNVLIGVIILLTGIILGNFVQNVVRSTVEAAGLASAHLLSALAKWSIVTFSFMAALVQLQIAEDLIRTLFTGLVFMLALAGGLAFGLGGREHASEFLTRLKKEISSEK